MTEDAADTWLVWWQIDDRGLARFVSRDRRPPDTHGHQLVVALDVTEPDAAGFPRPLEVLHLDRLMWQLAHEMEVSLGGHTTSLQLRDGRMVLRAWVPSTAGWRQVIDPLSRRGLVAEASTVADPEQARWSAEERPPVSVLRQREVWRTLETRTRRGDVLSQPRPVTLTVAFPSTERRAEALRSLLAEGWTVEALDDGTGSHPFHADVVRTLALVSLPSAVAGMEVDLAGHGLRVEDWGAPDVTTHPPPADLPEDQVALVRHADELGSGERWLVHGAAFHSEADLDAFASRAGRLGFELLDRTSPPADVPVIGRPHHLRFQRADPGDWLPALVGDLDTLVREHDGRYEGFEPEPLLGNSPWPEPRPPTPEDAPPRPPDPSVSRFLGTAAPTASKLSTWVEAGLWSLVAPGAGHAVLGQRQAVVAVWVAVMIAIVLSHALLLERPALGHLLCRWWWLLPMATAALAATTSRGAARAPHAPWMLAATMDLSYAAVTGLARLEIASSQHQETVLMWPAIAPGTDVVAVGRLANHKLRVGELVWLDSIGTVARVVGLPGQRLATERGRLVRTGIARREQPAIEVCGLAGAQTWWERHGDTAWLAWTTEGAPTIDEEVVPSDRVALATDARSVIVTAPLHTVWLVDAPPPGCDPGPSPWP
ncbi:MAG: hypothetical protein H6738_20690 [Alphaproteobacteria bacterium]|nr:hypothetical protein [Alphaproteobacteria bacterium]